jgi:hypothetical protein
MTMMMNETSPAKKTRTRGRQRLLTDAVQESEYKTDQTLTFPHRMAHFLDWAAARYPHQFIAYNYVYKAITGQKSKPRIDSEDAQRMSRMVTRVRQILQRDYSRDLHCSAGVGVRATVDDADTLQSTLPVKMRRLRAARESVNRTVGLIDVKKLPNTAEMVPWKKWLSSSVTDVVKMLNSDSFSKGMLPPAAPPAEDGNA